MGSTVTTNVNKIKHAVVIDHCDKVGLKIGTFYDKAAEEKIARDAKKPKPRRIA